MSKIIIGCDPDSSKSGIAIYERENLTQLHCLELIDVIDCFASLKSRSKEVELHIENLNGNRCSSFNWHPKDTKGVRAKKSESVGKCKQAQVEIERIAEHFGVKVVYHQVSKMWKKDKAQFEKVTGWTGRSNEDSRSAAWFGYLGLTAKQ